MIEELRSKELIRRFSNLQRAKQQVLIKTEDTKEKIHIVYVMTNVHICGGVKIIFEHTNRLKRFGMQVTIVSHFPKPSWYPIESAYIQVPFTIELAKGIPNCDVIIATYWDHIQSCIDTGIAPVVYFEQGDFHLFEPETLNEEYKNFIYRQFQLPQFIITVSEKAAEDIKRVYHRESTVIHNGLQDAFFQKNNVTKQEESPYILMMGNDSLDFKGINDIVTAYEIVKKNYPELKLYWITPYDTQSNVKTKVDQTFINPLQDEISKLYRNATLFVSGSHYESFSLPVLEAMASGCPVVTTENTGVLEYAENLFNALTAKIKEPNDIAEKIIRLLNDSLLKEKLIENGLKTAEVFKWDTIIPKLYSYYKDIAIYRVKENNMMVDWESLLNINSFINAQEYSKFKKYLLYTECDEVQVPLSSLNLKKFSLIRWETVAKRKKEQGLYPPEKCYCKVKIDCKQVQNLYNDEALEDFLNTNYEAALHKLLENYHSERDTKVKMVYAKWVVLTLFRLKRIDEAFLLIETFLKQCKDYSDLYYLYFRLLLFAGKTDLASSILNTINDLGDAVSYPEYILNIVKTSNRVWDDIYNKDLSDYEVKSLETLDFTTEELFIFGNILNTQGRYEEAIECYLEFLERNDSWSEHSISVCCNISDCYFYIQKLEEAKKYCYKSFEYDLPRAEACCKLGFLLLQENRIKDAIFWYDLSTRLEKHENDWPFCYEPSWTWLPHLQLCVCYDNLGDHKKAYAHNEIARKYDPNNKSILHNQKYFKSLGF
ncbi:glycosyltransferase [Wukongibacter baidiensis]|uniref:glycosyltransferase n=1 Tax=Wukongibacter baidiensis TaxID=1723361 RepID=UPI003D7F92E0